MKVILVPRLPVPGPLVPGPGPLDSAKQSPSRRCGICAGALGTGLLRRAFLSVIPSGNRRLSFALIFSLAGLIVAAMPNAGHAQATRVKSLRARPNLILGDTLTVMATPSAVNFTLVEGGVAAGSTTVSINTTWTGLSAFASLSLSAYFSSATQALSGGSPIFYIPSSAVLGKVPTGSPTSFTAFTQSAPLGPAGAGLLLYTAGGLISLGGSRTDVLSLEINLAGVPQTPAATYTGFITLQAQAF